MQDQKTVFIAWGGKGAGAGSGGGGNSFTGTGAGAFSGSLSGGGSGWGYALTETPEGAEFVSAGAWKVGPVAQPATWWQRLWKKLRIAS